MKSKLVLTRHSATLQSNNRMHWYHILILAICSLVSGDPVTSPLITVVNSNSQFSPRFVQALDGKDNLVCSPLSANLALELARLGARGNTAKQITDALHLPASGLEDGFKLLINELKDENDTTVLIANRIYTDQTLHSDFNLQSRDSLSAEAVTVNFSNPETATQINSWVEQETQGKIKNLLGSDSLSDASLLLVNTLYFKGSWEYPFDNVKTQEFHVNNSRSVEVPFLHLLTVSYDNVRLAELPDLSSRLLGLPYKGRKFHFVIILPYENSTLEELEEKMKTRDLDDLLKQSHTTNQWRVAIPQVNLESSLDLEEPLKKMGMTDMFDRSTADFSGMLENPSPPLFVSKAMQKTIIELTRYGTEASAATFLKVHPVSLVLHPPAPFIANRPFLFYLVHQTSEDRSTVLFSGRFVSPP